MMTDFDIRYARARRSLAALDSIRRYRAARAAVEADHLRRLDVAMALVAAGEISPAEAANIVGVSITTIRSRAKRSGIVAKQARATYLARVAASIEAHPHAQS